LINNSILKISDEHIAKIIWLDGLIICEITDFFEGLLWAVQNRIKEIKICENQFFNHVMLMDRIKFWAQNFHLNPILKDLNPKAQNVIVCTEGNNWILSFPSVFLVFFFCSVFFVFYKHFLYLFSFLFIFLETILWMGFDPTPDPKFFKLIKIL
jgi:hypothetical protein